MACGPYENEIARRKKALRAEIRRRTDALSAQAAAVSSERIASDVLASAWYREAASVFLYVSVGKEPDTMPILLKALADGKAVYVPKCREKPMMDAVRLSAPEALRPGAMGIPEPAADGPAADRVDLAIVPCLSVSPEGDRLGHGGGYYDAFLRARPCRTICLCHEALLSEHIPRAGTDVRMDAYTCGEGIVPCVSRDC